MLWNMLDQGKSLGLAFTTHLFKTLKKLTAKSWKAGQRRCGLSSEHGHRVQPFSSTVTHHHLTRTELSDYFKNTRVPITTFCGAPIIYRQLVGRGSDAFVGKFPRALKHCTSAGENLASRVIMDWHEMTDLIVYNGFGQTETSILCGSYPSMTLKMDSMAMPLPGVPLEILNNEGETAAPFEEGAIAVNVSEGSEFCGIFEGYILEDGSVSRPTVTDEDGQIWYMTGDRAHSDEYGYFFYKGRGDDVIILPAIGLASLHH